MKAVRLALCCAFLLVAAPVYSQVQTGSIVGIVTDGSGAVLPGVVVTLTGERLIGGAQTAPAQHGFQIMIGLRMTLRFAQPLGQSRLGLAFESFELNQHRWNDELGTMTCFANSLSIVPTVYFSLS